jgi:hypothetical protein
VVLSSVALLWKGILPNYLGQTLGRLVVGSLIGIALGMGRRPVHRVGRRADGPPSSWRHRRPAGAPFPRRRVPAIIGTGD